MIRLANELDLPAVAAIYEAILDHEDATGIHYTGWQRGAYPTADTARSIFDAGTLYVGVDETGSVWGSMNLNGVQLPEYKTGKAKPFCVWIPARKISPLTECTPHWATKPPAPWTRSSWGMPSAP